LVETEDGKLDWYEEHFCPKGKVLDESGIHTKKYAGWAADGYINLTPGNVIDFEVISDFLIELNGRMIIKQIGYDPWQATQLATNLFNNENITMVEIPNGVKNFSGPMKEIEAMVKKGDIRHCGNPVTKWMIANVVCRLDHKDNIYPQKVLKKPENKIDVVVAGIMAMNRYMDREEEYDCYSERGVLTA